jgi:3-hydroxymyristoyl/3-hydroxydecanoyl-(acyl carrier protein) dehydratase
MTELTLSLSVAADHPAYAGHFPGHPVLPGVVLLDEALHALAKRQGLDAAAGQIKSAKFPSPVRPGETLRLNYGAAGAGVFRFEVMAGEGVAASGVFAFAATVPGDGAS